MSEPRDPVISSLLHSADICSLFDFTAFNSCWEGGTAARQPVCSSVRVDFDPGTSTFNMFIGMLLGSSLASQLHGWWPDTAPLHLALHVEVDVEAACGFSPEVVYVARTDGDGSCFDGLLNRECDASLIWLRDKARLCVREWTSAFGAHPRNPDAHLQNLFISLAVNVAFALKQSIGRFSCVSSVALLSYSPIPCPLEAGVNVQQHDHEQASVDAGTHGMCLCDALAAFQVGHLAVL